MPFFFPVLRQQSTNLKHEATGKSHVEKKISESLRSCDNCNPVTGFFERSESDRTEFQNGADNCFSQRWPSCDRNFYALPQRNAAKF